jgi:hypothetical protein
VAPINAASPEKEGVKKKYLSLSLFSQTIYLILRPY